MRRNTLEYYCSREVRNSCFCFWWLSKSVLIIILVGPLVVIGVTINNNSIGLFLVVDPLVMINVLLLQSTVIVLVVFGVIAYCSQL